MNKLFKLSLKKFNYQVIFALVFGLLLIGSCKKELLDSPNKKSIAWAKEYYNATLAISKPNAVSGDKNSQPGATTTESVRTPLWELSSNGENEDFTFVEVPLDYNHRIASVIKIPGEELTTAEKIDIANASFDVLMIYKNRQGIISQQVVTLIPDRNYLKKHNGDMSGNTLAKLDSDFSGFLRYRDWNGGKMFLERIEDGQLVKTSGSGHRIIKRAVKITRSSQGKVMNPPMGGGDSNCETTEYYDFLIDCWQIFSQLTCQAIYLGEHSETTCFNGDGGIITEPTLNQEDPGDKYELLIIADSIKLAKKFECFNSVPDNTATIYSVKLYAELADKNRPGALLNSSLAPGHTFISMTKTNGSTSVTETFGFYPESATKAAFQVPVKSMMVDNQDHDYQASLSMTVTANQFTAMMNTAVTKGQNNYSMTGYNCTNFALDVFNQGRSTPLYVPNNVGVVTGMNYGKTPTGVYEVIKSMQTNGVSGASIGAGKGMESTECNN